jgi:hypothetical protein
MLYEERATAMPTKSIRLSEQEAAELRQYLAATGEVEAVALKRAAMRGLKDLRQEQALLTYLEGRGAFEAAQIAGLSRAEFLQLLVEKGITVLEGPSTLGAELDALAREFDSERLARAAKQLDPSPD